MTKGEIARQSTPRIVKEDEAMNVELLVELLVVLLRIVAAGTAG